MPRRCITKLALSTFAATMLTTVVAGAASAADTHQPVTATVTAPSVGHARHSGTDPGTTPTAVAPRPTATWNWGTACWSAWTPTPVYNQYGAIINWRWNWAPVGVRAVALQITLGNGIVQNHWLKTTTIGCISYPLLSGAYWRFNVSMPTGGWRATTWRWMPLNGGPINWGRSFG